MQRENKITFIYTLNILKTVNIMKKHKMNHPKKPFCSDDASIHYTYNQLKN